MAARSFRILLRNITNLTLRRTDLKLDHGEFSNGGGFVPPETIAPLSRGEWQSESDGGGTGTEGSVVYTSDRGDLRIHWDNPFIGSNVLEIEPPNGFDFSNTDISGNDASVTVTFSPLI